MLNDLESHHEWKESPKAPIVLVQSKHIYLVLYGFGDSSGGGFGTSLNCSKFGLVIHVGTWNQQGSEKSQTLDNLGIF